MPLWLFLLKGFFLESSVKIPFGDVALNLLMVKIPVIGGMLLRWKFPRAAHFVTRIIKPMALAFIVFALTFGIYVNWYIFRLFYRTPLVIAVGAMLPWVGFFIGTTAAFVLRQSRPQIIAIGLETGIQNVGIAILILMFTLPQPEGSLGAAVPMAVALLTPLPLYILYAVIKLRQRCCPPQSASKAPLTPQQTLSPEPDEPPEIFLDEARNEDDEDDQATVSTSLRSARQRRRKSMPLKEVTV